MITNFYCPFSKLSYGYYAQNERKTYNYTALSISKSMVLLEHLTVI